MFFFIWDFLPKIEIDPAPRHIITDI